MSSIDSPSIIRTILEHNGVYPGDPQCFSVLTYQTPEGGRCFAITSSERDAERYNSSEFVRAPRNLWTREHGLTPAGHSFLKEQEPQQ